MTQNQITRPIRITHMTSLGTDKALSYLCPVIPYLPCMSSRRHSDTDVVLPPVCYIHSTELLSLVFECMLSYTIIMRGVKW